MRRSTALVACICLVVSSGSAATTSSTVAEAPGSASSSRVVSGFQDPYVGGLLYSRVTVSSRPRLAGSRRCRVAKAVARSFAMHSSATLRPPLSGSPQFGCSSRAVDVDGNTMYSNVRCVSLSRYTATVRFRVSS